MSRFALWTARSLVPLLLTCPALASSQDVYIESRTHTDPVKMMGHSMPAQDGVNRTWIGDGKIAMLDDAAGRSIIVRSDQGKIFVVDSKAKTYYESKLPFELPPEVTRMMAAMKPEVTVTPTSQTRVVNGFNATLTKVTIKMAGQDVAMDYWVSKDVGVPREQIQRVTQAMFAANPMLSELGQKMSSIEGYPVRVDTRVTAMGSTFGSWQEVTKIEKKAAPPGIYEIPQGFTKTDALPMRHG